ncbi:MAG TPA: hypothetical protein VF082_01900 [Jiangellaceae bacterium]
MTMLTPRALAAAERYVLLNARLIDRLRFAHLFRDGSAAAVRSALTAYANDDGGFGNALEPDLRGSGSQPQPVEVALRLLDETTGPGDPFDGPIVEAVCGYLARISTSDGGVPFVLPSVRGTPAAPWWQTPDGPPGNLNPTAAIVGLLHKHGVSNDFVDTATRFCWDRIDALTETKPYVAMAVLTFLDHVPDPARAEAAFDRLSPLIVADVELDPHATGEVHLPLDLAPHPDGFARRLFADEVVAEHLDALVRGQSEDGSWGFNWPAWTPVVQYEWGGYVTVGRLRTLRDYGRIAS